MNTKKMLRVAVSGPPASGTSSLAKHLSLFLPVLLEIDTPDPIPIFSSGQICRRMAKKLNMSLEDFQELMKTDPGYDDEIDTEVRRMVEDTSQYRIFDSRLAGFFARYKHDVFTIRLTCKTKVAARRIQSDRINKMRPGENTTTNLREIMRDIARRRIAENARYKKYKGYRPSYPVNLTINTTYLTELDVLRAACKGIEWHWKNIM